MISKRRFFWALLSMDSVYAGIVLFLSLYIASIAPWHHPFWGGFVLFALTTYYFLEAAAPVRIYRRSSSTSSMRNSTSAITSSTNNGLISSGGGGIRRGGATGNTHAMTQYTYTGTAKAAATTTTMTALPSEVVTTTPNAPATRRVEAMVAGTLERMQCLRGRGYAPTFYLLSPTLQTFYAAIGRPAPGVAYDRELVMNAYPDGEVCVLDWSFSAAAGDQWSGATTAAAAATTATTTFQHNRMSNNDQSSTRSSKNNNNNKKMAAPVIILFHGLTGGSDDSNMHYLTKIFNARGWHVVIPVRRGCGEANLLTRGKHYAYGAVDDTAIAVRYISRKMRGHPLLAVGISAGSNVMCNYLGRRGPLSRIRGAVSVANGFCWNAGTSALEREHPVWCAIMSGMVAQNLLKRHDRTHFHNSSVVGSGSSGSRQSINTGTSSANHAPIMMSNTNSFNSRSLHSQRQQQQQGHPHSSLVHQPQQHLGGSVITSTTAATGAVVAPLTDAQLRAHLMRVSETSRSVIISERRGSGKGTQTLNDNGKGTDDTAEESDEYPVNPKADAKHSKKKKISSFLAGVFSRETSNAVFDEGHSDYSDNRALNAAVLQSRRSQQQQKNSNNTQEHQQHKNMCKGGASRSARATRSGRAPSQGALGMAPPKFPCEGMFLTTSEEEDDDEAFDEKSNLVQNTRRSSAGERRVLLPSSNSTAASAAPPTSATTGLIHVSGLDSSNNNGVSGSGGGFGLSTAARGAYSAVLSGTLFSGHRLNSTVATLPKPGMLTTNKSFDALDEAEGEGEDGPDGAASHSGVPSLVEGGGLVQARGGTDVRDGEYHNEDEMDTHLEQQRKKLKPTTTTTAIMKSPPPPSSSSPPPSHTTANNHHHQMATATTDNNTITSNGNGIYGGYYDPRDVVRTRYISRYLRDVQQNGSSSNPHRRHQTDDMDDEAGKPSKRGGDDGLRFPPDCFDIPAAQTSSKKKSNHKSTTAKKGLTTTNVGAELSEKNKGVKTISGDCGDNHEHRHHDDRDDSHHHYDDAAAAASADGHDEDSAAAAVVLKHRYAGIREYDELVSRRLHGYPSLEAFYKDQSCINHIHNIQVPTIFLNALDDPIASSAVIPIERIESNPCTALVTTQSGGHLGWADALVWPFSGTTVTWMERFVVSALEGFLELAPLHGHRL